MFELPGKYPLIIAILASLTLSTNYFLSDFSAQADLSDDVLDPDDRVQKILCHCIAFRLDDVQDYPYSSSLIEVMELFREKNIPLTVGVVGNNTDTDKKQIFYYLRGTFLTSNNDSNIKNNQEFEIANHSWEHKRFLNFSFPEQVESIRKTNEKIKSSFGKWPTIFIPPNNEFNKDTLLATDKNNMTIISADERDGSTHTKYLNSTIYHLPETAETGYCRICSGKNFSWHGIKSDETLSQIKKSIDRRGYAIIVMHPMEYSMEHEDPVFQNSIDVRQVQELGLLLDKIKLEGFQIVNVGQIANYFS